jgi:hypothetical protein
MKRRRQLVRKGGIEIFELRIVQWLNGAGEVITSVEATLPEGQVPEGEVDDLPSLGDLMGALELAKYQVFRWYEPPDVEP